MNESYKLGLTDILLLFVFALVFVFGLFITCGPANDNEVINEGPTPLLEVNDYPLLTEEAKKEARETGRTWAYIDGELVIFESLDGLDGYY